MKRLVLKGFDRLGYEVRRRQPPSPAELERQAYAVRACDIVARHERQTADAVLALREQYRKPLLGKVDLWSVVEQLALCVDPSDMRLHCTSQYVHVQQILQGMQADGIVDEDMLLIALLHDVGKIMLLHGAPPEDVVCFNQPVGSLQDGAGFDRCLFQYNHDEFAYDRLKDYVPDHVAWVIRYHSIHLEPCARLMNDRDRDYAERYLRPFQVYDHGTKSMYRLPSLDMAYYRSLLADRLPRQILI